MKNISIFSDGGSRGNPGPAAVGFVIKDGNTNLFEGSNYIGETTNNQAEYMALIGALEWIAANLTDDAINMQFFLDSQLVVEQVKGNYKMKNEGLKPLLAQIRVLIADLGGQATFTHIPREQNKEADLLVNLALDQFLKGDQ